MSHPGLHLDEVPEDDLRSEMEARAERRAHGRCDYCNRLQTEPPCKFPNRHRALSCAECGKLLSSSKRRRAPIGAHLLCKKCFAREQK